MVYCLWVPVDFFVENAGEVKATPSCFSTTVLQLKDQEVQSEFQSRIESGPNLTVLDWVRPRKINLFFLFFHYVLLKKLVFNII